MEQKTRLTGGFQTGLTAGLGVMTAILLATAVSQLATVITYVVMALLLALGLNPLVKLLQKIKFPKMENKKIKLISLRNHICVNFLVI
jgi:predicted PurR-regulated permease PerM